MSWLKASSTFRSLLKKPGCSSPSASHFSTRAPVVPKARNWGLVQPSRFTRPPRPPPPSPPPNAEGEPRLPRSPVDKRFLAHRDAMRRSFPEGWSPPKKISREAMDGLRMLHAHDPEKFSLAVLADKFKISPEAVRRILKSKWAPSQERSTKLLQREKEHREARIRETREKEREESRNIGTDSMNEMFSKEGWSTR